MKANKGFTFVELLASAAVLVIVGVAFSSIAFSIVRYSRRLEAKREMQEISDALLRYYQDFGFFPPTLSDLVIRPTPATNRWRGPYLNKTLADLLGDPWRNPVNPQGMPYLYFPGRFVPSNIQVALLLSTGQNRAMETNLLNWDSEGNWNAGGDDIAIRISPRKIDPLLSHLTNQTLTRLAGILLTANPTGAPMNFNAPQYPDEWGNRIQYNRCTLKSAVLYSYGPDGIDNSDGGNLLCSGIFPNNDDVFLVVNWELRYIPYPPTWTGGFDVNPVACATYSFQVTNLYSTSITVYHSGWRSVSIPARSTRNISTDTRTIEVKQGILTLDYFRPYETDLDSNCIVQKRYGKI